MAGWWEIGGRIRFGETSEQAAARSVAAETGLTFPTRRFQPFAAYMVMWKNRAQAPQQRGTHAIIIDHALIVSKQTFSKIHLNPEEYTGETMLLAPREVLIKVKQGILLPYFQTVVGDLRRARLLDA